MERAEFLQCISRGDIHGVYLLDGSDANLRAEALAALRRRLLPAGLEELNEVRLDNPSEDDIRAACETLPFMADRRLVLVDRYSAFGGRARRTGDGDDEDSGDEETPASSGGLAAYVRSLPDTCVLVFTWQGKANGNSALTRAIRKTGQTVTFDALKGPALTAWVTEAFRELGVECTARTAELLIFTSGSDSTLLRGEIAKLAASVGGRAQVTDADVQAGATHTVEYTVFRLVDAVIAGQEGRALGLLRDMLRNGEQPLMILAMLLRQYRLIQHVKIMRYEKLPQDRMVSALGYTPGHGLPFQVESLLRQSSAVSNAEAKYAVAALIDTEFRIKSGVLQDVSGLEAVLLRLFAFRHARRAT